MSAVKSSPVKLVRLLANLGYGSRKQVTQMLKNGWVSGADGRELGPDDALDPQDAATWSAVRVDDEPLDPPPGLVLMLHKPIGYTCSMRDHGQLIYDLLPPRYRLRDPLLSSVGRLDRETSGLILLTDDGALLHRIISPKSRVTKVYLATLAADLKGHEAALFASGTLLLEGENEPLAPVHLDVLDARRVRVHLTEGRYHQVRRMFAATGNHVEHLERVAVGALTLAGLAPGAWQALTAQDVARVFEPATASAAGLAANGPKNQ
jgi:16S rRNA pseudouridine516 synthase